MNLFRKINLVLLFVLSVSGAFAQTYDFRTFNVEDGLAQSQVLSICQDKNGNLWFGTNSGGASRYDGNRFVTFTENDSLINNVVFSITELKNGDLLFGTNGGLSIKRGKHFINYDEVDGLPHSRVFKTFQDSKGKVWICTGKGICQMEGQKFTTFTADSTLAEASVFTMHEDRAGNLWFGTISQGAIKYDPQTQKLRHYNMSNGLRDNFVRTINEDLQGNIYIGMNSGLARINFKGAIEKVNIAGEENIAFIDIVPDNKNNLWLATSAGVYKYNGYVYKNYREKNGLASNKLFCAFRDREGNLWFGTDGFGVSRFAGEAILSYSSADSLPGDYITSIFQDSRRNIWLGVKNFGVVRFKNGNFQNFRFDPKNLENSLSDNEVLSISEDAAGNMFFGTKEGLSVYDGKDFHNYTTKHGLPHNIIYSILRDGSGTMWLGTQNGLCSFNNGVFTPARAVNDLGNERGNIPFYSICEDRNRHLWLATENGAIKYDRVKANRLSKADGLTDKRVTSILQDERGFLWFGTDQGVFSYNYTRFDTINEADGLASNKVYLMLRDKEDLWIGTNKGLDRISLRSYHNDNTIQIKHYGKEEGLRGVECNSNAQLRDAEGNLWFGTIKGATVYNSRYDRRNAMEPLTRITGIRLFFQDAGADLEKYSVRTDSISGLPAQLELPYDRNHVTFDFIGISITNPGKVRYQFRLEGADSDWFPPTSKTEATYSSLPPGDYTFYLKAMNNDGVWNEHPVSFRFSILPPWWKTWWFYTLAALAAFGGIYLFIFVRTRNLQKAKIDLEQEVQLRTYQLRMEKEKVEVVNKEVVAQKAIIEAKNHDITDSIKYAKNIQEALLPPLQNLYRELEQAFVLYLPKDIVSGDFYWFARRNNRRYIASVDCTGHGVPGAFMSIVGNTLLNEIVTDKNISKPEEILNELHLGVKTALKQNNSTSDRRDGMDIALCCVSEDGNYIEYAGANRPLWIYRYGVAAEDAFQLIKPDKFPIGGLEMENEEKRQFTGHRIEVKKGDMVYMFSDGFADQFGGPRGKKFMVGNMQKLISGIYHLPVKEQEKQLVQSFMEWKGDLEQVDDVLVIGFRI